MWTNLPFDLLAYIFSYLPPESFARAKAACRNWRTAAGNSVPAQTSPWFVAFLARSRGASCYIHNPIGEKWHVLPLDHINNPIIRPIAATNGLVLLKVTSTTSLQLAIYNPCTKQFRSLPSLNVTRTNPAVGLVDHDSRYNFSSLRYKIYVAGGMSEAASGGGAVYQPTMEMYDSFRDTWNIVGQMPVEFAVRLTVWTPNESVCSDGILYWMTSARAYSVMGFEIRTSKWRELRVPMPDKLEFAALVPRNGKLAMVGGIYGGDVCIWELGGDEVWSVIEKVPLEFMSRLLGNCNKTSWGSVKCAGIDGGVCLYRDLGSGIIVWRKVVGEDKWDWAWIEGCGSIRGSYIQNLPIKGLLLHPSLDHSNF